MDKLTENWSSIHAYGTKVWLNEINDPFSTARDISINFPIILEFMLLHVVQHWKKLDDSSMRTTLILYYIKVVKSKMTCVLILVYLHTILKVSKTLKRYTHTILGWRLTVTMDNL